jgi:hypothetical protein
MPRLAATLLRWTVTVLAALAVAGAVASGWCMYALAYVRLTPTTAPATPATVMTGVMLSVDRGCYEYTSARFGAHVAGIRPGWHFNDLTTRGGDVPRWRWLQFNWSSATSREFTAVIPTWAPALLLLALAAAAWRGPLLRRSRRRAGRCVQCSYDRRGLPDPSSTPCPECGAPAGR